VLAILHQLCETSGHVFWPDDVSLRDVLVPGAIITHAQVTDVYLAGLAARRQGRLATLDRRIPTAAIRDGGDVLELVSAD
jgi:uncharacterized protein